VGQLDRGPASLRTRHAAASGERALDDYRHVPRGATRPRASVQSTQDLASARSGHPYPLDWWAEGIGRADRPGLARYDNSLPLPMMLRLVRAFSDPGEHVVDSFVGGGTTAIACWQAGRRFTGGDVNPHAVRFTAARLLSEHAWPAERQPSLLCD
jgi:hypothetical protein